MAVLLSKAKRDWLIAHLTGGAEPTEQLGSIERRFLIQEVGSDSEKQWLRQVISDNGGTPSGTIYEGELWKEANAVLGLDVSKRMEENQLTFYLNAP